MKSLKIQPSTVLQEKIGDHPSKTWGKNGPVLFFTLKYYCRVTCHLHGEAIFFPIG